MVEAVLHSAGIFKKLIDSIKDLVSDCTLACTRNGIRMQAMDASHISLVSMQLNSTGFQQYKCSKKFNLGVNLVSLAKLLKCAGANDSMKIKASPHNDTLSLSFTNPDESIISQFEMKLIDISEETVSLPAENNVCIAKIPSGEYQKICRDLLTMGEDVRIQASPRKITFSSFGQIGSGGFTLQQNIEDENSKISIITDEKIDLTFTLKYLNLFAKAGPLCDFVTLYLSPKSPLMVEFTMGQLGFIRYYLAPKVDEANESDDEDDDKDMKQD
ncbi:proliferating cell nuclear antigen [Anaeramoeba ignava]|uniref:DNA sliding clamp PCNA n=1 Tax=Anaeramoeba ignava TaxID=1746090 RepID=A0A9Q0LKH0_ANAIG|nr:proliferating cell nuclear antigen [Anaeramoeba ignava]